jgi:N utilization substance protein A
MGRRKQRRNAELGSNSAGQSGDIQQMPNAPEADSESVEELAEEGNAFEADAVQGVEDALDPDVSEVTTRQVPEDDVPPEYLDDEDEHVA